MRTALCELIGIDVPIVQAPLGPWNTVKLAAAVSNAGALGSLATNLRSAETVREEMRRLRAATDRPFAVNHTLRPLDEDAFDATLEGPPAVVSFALGFRSDLVERAHAAGALFMQQVHTVAQATEAAEGGVDVVVAQGAEAGGFGGFVSTMALVPQVVDAVSPVPVVAAGGIADGRGLAAALTLGAEGVNVGTRFLAAAESGAPDAFRQAIVGARSEESVKVDFADAVFPPAGEGGYGTRPRVLETPFVEEWNRRLAEVATEAPQLRDELMRGLQEGRAHEYVPFSGQTAGLIRDVLPAAEIVRRIVEGAEAALRLPSPSD
jgi:nitronate monooxygenase/enoyl-[acyl-carrier protein] reductase II